jgi:hypothetical protein
MSCKENNNLSLNQVDGETESLTDSKMNGLRETDGWTDKKIDRL